MMRNSLMLIALLCSCDGRPLGTEQEGLAGASVLGHLQSRDRRLTFYASDGSIEGPRFAVTTLRGEVLAEGLKVDELRARHPDLYRIYESSMARRTAPGGRAPLIDASLQLPASADTADRR